MEKYILGFFYNKLKETDEAVGYLFGGLADEADSEYEFQKLAAYSSNHFTKSKIISSLTSVLGWRTILFKYRGNSIDNYYDT